MTLVSKAQLPQTTIATTANMGQQSWLIGSYAPGRFLYSSVGRTVGRSDGWSDGRPVGRSDGRFGRSQSFPRLPNPTSGFPRGLPPDSRGFQSQKELIFQKKVKFSSSGNWISELQSRFPIRDSFSPLAVTRLPNPKSVLLFLLKVSKKREILQ